MTVIDKVVRMFGLNRHENTTSDVAIEKARSVGQQADHLNARLLTYLDAEDPFKAFAVDVFERGQEKRTYYGPRDRPPS